MHNILSYYFLKESLCEVLEEGGDGRYFDPLGAKWFKGRQKAFKGLRQNRFTGGPFTDSFPDLIKDLV